MELPLFIMHHCDFPLISPEDIHVHWKTYGAIFVFLKKWCSFATVFLLIKGARWSPLSTIFRRHMGLPSSTSTFPVWQLATSSVQITSPWRYNANTENTPPFLFYIVKILFYFLFNLSQRNLWINCLWSVLTILKWIYSGLQNSGGAEVLQEAESGSDKSSSWGDMSASTWPGARHSSGIAFLVLLGLLPSYYVQVSNLTWLCRT